MRVECAPGIVRNLAADETCFMPSYERVGDVQAFLHAMMLRSGDFDPGTMSILTDLGSRYAAGALTRDEAARFEGLIRSYEQTMTQLFEGAPAEPSPASPVQYTPGLLVDERMTEAEARKELHEMLSQFSGHCVQFFPGNMAQRLGRAQQIIDQAETVFESSARGGGYEGALTDASNTLADLCPEWSNVRTQGACCGSCAAGGECEGAAA